MSHQTLLSHLAFNFTNQPENLATEALCHILQGSATARTAIVRLLRQARIGIGGGLSFQSQVSAEDGSRPDLVGCDDLGREIVLLEAKFWAGLTDNQPQAYVQRLADSVPSVLLFVVPERRMTSLSCELLERMQVSVQPTDSHLQSGVTTLTCQDCRSVAITSWRYLLAAVLSDLDASGELAMAADVQQLQGLCERMDEEAFLPLRSEDFSPAFPRRALNLIRVIEDVVAQAVKEEWASNDGLRAAGTAEGYVRYMRLHGVGVSLELNFTWWARLRATPLWLKIRGWDTKKPITYRKALSDLEHEVPPRLIVDGNQMLIPLRLPLGVSQGMVLRSILDQVRMVADRIGEQERQPSTDQPKTTG